jgi:hypothetical protein
MRLFWILRAGLCSLLLPLVLTAQTEPPKEALPASAQPLPQDKSKTLSSLLLTRDSLRKELDAQRQRLQAESSATGKQEVQDEIERLEKRRQELDRDFNVMTTGRDSLVDLDAQAEAQAPMKLQDEIGQLLTPIFSDLREMTRKPQEMQALRQALETQLAQQQQAESALAEVDNLLADLKKSQTPPAAHLLEELAATRQRWIDKRDEASSRVQVMAYELSTLEATSGNFWSELGSQVTDFIFVRGANIALAVLAFLIVLFGLRGAYYYALKIVPVKKYEKLSFSSRILDVVHEGVSLVLAIGAALLVLYARGDWLLGGLALLAVGAMVMTAKDGIAQHMSNLQMMLNLGCVREGERVYINGVPWRVGAIHMFTQLTNLVIGGPGLRLPLDVLSTLTSRPSSLDEPWFPCAKRSHVLLGGTLFAQVTDITPDRVELLHGGGLKRWMPIGDFMKADVSCLSGGFARSITLGLDYQYQAQALTEIPAILQADVRRVLLEKMREEELLNVIVEFDQAAESSLKFIIVGVFAGTQAANYPSLPRLLQRAALDSATRHGWNIPFPQMVLHRAAP